LKETQEELVKKESSCDKSSHQSHPESSESESEKNKVKKSEEMRQEYTNKFDEKIILEFTKVMVQLYLQSGQDWMVIKQTILKFGQRRQLSMETFDAPTLLEALTCEERFQIELK